MNQTEFDLITKDQLIKMYENVCDELEEYESKYQAGCDSCDEYSSELYHLENENDALRRENEELKYIFDTKGAD